MTQVSRPAPDGSAELTTDPADARRCVVHTVMLQLHAWAWTPLVECACLCAVPLHVAACLRKALVRSLGSATSSVAQGTEVTGSFSATSKPPTTHWATRCAPTHTHQLLQLRHSRRGLLHLHQSDHMSYRALGSGDVGVPLLCVQVRGNISLRRLDTFLDEDVQVCVLARLGAQQTAQQGHMQ